MRAHAAWCPPDTPTSTVGVVPRRVIRAPAVGPSYPPPGPFLNQNRIHIALRTQLRIQRMPHRLQLLGDIEHQSPRFGVDPLLRLIEVNPRILDRIAQRHFEVQNI